MRINLQREMLLKPLQMVIGVVERKQTIPILSNVLLNIKDNKLSFTGTDTEIELIAHVDKDEIDPLVVLTLPGRKLLDICRALPENAPIELYQEKEKVILSSGRSRFMLSTLPAKDFPNIETHNAYFSFTIEQQQLKQLLQRTYFAMAQADVRYYLNGMLFELQDNQLRTVATDGHRLAFNMTHISSAAPEKMQVIIPRKGILELLRLLEDHDREIGITLSNGHIHVITDNFMFTSKLIEGRYPNYDRVIPRNGNKSILIDRDTLKQSLSRSAILSNEKFRGVRLELGSNQIKITTNNPEQECAEEEIHVEYSDEILDIGFNINYLLDVLNIVKPGLVKLTFKDSDSSVVIEEVENEWFSVFVIMPMRL